MAACDEWLYQVQQQLGHSEQGSAARWTRGETFFLDGAAYAVLGFDEWSDEYICLAANGAIFDTDSAIYIPTWRMRNADPLRPEEAPAMPPEGLPSVPMWAAGIPPTNLARRWGWQHPATPGRRAGRQPQGEECLPCGFATALQVLTKPLAKLMRLGADQPAAAPVATVAAVEAAATAAANAAAAVAATAAPPTMTTDPPSLNSSSGSWSSGSSVSSILSLSSVSTGSTLACAHGHESSSTTKGSKRWGSGKAAEKHRGTRRDGRATAANMSDLREVEERQLLSALRPVPRQLPDAAEDILITIPIVKPLCWDEVGALLVPCSGCSRSCGTGGCGGRLPALVTFDERGLREAMTVKRDRWESFVERQKEQLANDIQRMRERRRQRSSRSEVTCSNSSGSSSDGSNGLPDGAMGKPKEDLAELEQMLRRMEVWKDLGQYAGKTIDMACTERGSELRLHVVAFSERQDGTGVDFVRLSYKKSLEVRRRGDPDKRPAGCWLPKPLGDLLPLSCSRLGSAEEHYVHLFRRPDVAKFAIAVTFREALAQDGVHLVLFEPRYDVLPFG